MKTIVIGLGNPIMTDDGVGIKVARELKSRLSPGSEVDVVELYAGGIRLMDAMMGYEKAVIIDAIVTGNSVPGKIFRLSPDDLLTTRNTISTHDMNLPTALELGRMLGIRLPAEIRIWGIEAEDVDTFGESLTDDVAKAVPEAVDMVIGELGLTA